MGAHSPNTMKTLLNLILGIAVLATLGGLATVEAVTSTNSSRSNGSFLTGTVSQVDQAAKTFTVTADGKQYKFLFPKSGMKHKVGAVVQVTANEEASTSNPVQATTVKAHGALLRPHGEPQGQSHAHTESQKPVTSVKSSRSNQSDRTANPKASPTPTPKAK